MKFEGKRGDYFWIEWQEAFLSDLISAFPELVINNFLINTSFNSGTLGLSNEEIKLGWTKNNELTISPLVTDDLDIPNCQYDEWYVFDSPTTFESYEVFVNYWKFSLEDFLTDIQERFWKQIESLSPETYLAEGDFLICVTKNEKLFNQISLWEEVKHN
jgi:hypothetical protein